MTRTTWWSEMYRNSRSLKVSDDGKFVILDFARLLNYTTIKLKRFEGWILLPSLGKEVWVQLKQEAQEISFLSSSPLTEDTSRIQVPKRCKFKFRLRTKSIRTTLHRSFGLCTISSFSISALNPLGSVTMALVYLLQDLTCLLPRK
jgi:hypothetical protein